MSDRLAELTERQRTRTLAKAAAVRDAFNGMDLQLAAARHDLSVATLRRAMKDVRGVAPGKWLDALAPDYSGCGRKTAQPIDPLVWRTFRADYMRLEQPSAASCYQRLAAWCEKRGKALPPAHQLTRKLRQIPKPQIVAARGGREALDRLYPAQQRTVAGLAPLERINGDGWPIDVFVEFPDGRVGRPVLWAWQDVLSRKVLTWRIAETESANLILSSFRDLCRQYGVPGYVHIDNTRAVSSSWLTAGLAGRKRFGSSDSFAGAFKTLGVQVHFTQLVATDGRTKSGKLRNRGRGQSKPVERFFKSLADELAKHPAFAGKYAGASPSTKPANHNSGAAGVPWSLLLDVAGAVIKRINARVGRQTETAGGVLSADSVFEQAISNHSLHKVGDIELDVMLTPAETVKVSREGTVRMRAGNAPGFGANRYWAEPLYGHVGEKLFARYDPGDLHGSIRLFDSDGRFVCEATCLMPGGFGSADDAARHNRARREFVRFHRNAESARARADQQLVDEVIRSEIGDERSGQDQEEERQARKPKRLRLIGKDGDTEASADSDAAERINRGWKKLQA